MMLSRRRLVAIGLAVTVLSAAGVVRAASPAERRYRVHVGGMT